MNLKLQKLYCFHALEKIFLLRTTGIISFA